MKPLADCRLYTFVDTAYLKGRDVASVAQQLCDGGSDLIQLRAKSSSPDEIRRMAEIILPVTHRAGIPLVINDYLEIAQEISAEFCHLGQEDFFDAGYTHVSQLTTPLPALSSPSEGEERAGGEEWFTFTPNPARPPLPSKKLNAQLALSEPIACPWSWQFFAGF